MPKSIVLAQPITPFHERTRRIEREPLPRNIGALLDEAANAVPDHTALVFIDSGETFTYRALRVDVHRLVSGLRAIGVRKGSHVGIMLPNIPEWPLTWLAIARIGAIAMPINTRCTGRELHYVLVDADAEYLIIHESFLPVLAAVPHPRAGHRGTRSSSRAAMPRGTTTGAIWSKIVPRTFQRTTNLARMT